MVVSGTLAEAASAAERRDLRKALARELHDGPIRELTTCILRLEGFRRTSPNHDMQMAISAVEEHARAALISMRRIITDLRDEPPEEDVASAIKGMVRRYGESTTTELRVVVSPTWPDLVPGPIALHVLRIVQEAVNNAVLHAHAHQVLIELKADSDRLEAVVSDDGEGIHPAVGDGMGITGMRERAVLLGGRLTVALRNPGTVVRLEVPMP